MPRRNHPGHVQQKPRGKKRPRGWHRGLHSPETRAALRELERQQLIAEQAA